MKKELSLEEKIENFRNVCINRYNALYLEDNYQKGNRLETKLIAQGKELIVLQEGVKALFKMLKDENEIVRYYSASIVFSLYPDEAKKTLKEIK